MAALGRNIEREKNSTVTAIIALCGYPLLKLEIRDLCQISTTAAIFLHYDYFRKTIWRLASVQFHF